MPKVKCAKCKKVISLEAIPADGVIQCTACGSAFRIRTKPAEQASSAAAAQARAPEPAGGAADFSFGAADAPATPSKASESPSKAPASPGKAPDFGFLGGAAPPSQSDSDALPSFEVASKTPAAKTPAAKREATANPKAAAKNAAADKPDFVFAPDLAAEPKTRAAAAIKPAAAIKKSAGAEEPPELAASPYTSPAPALAEPQQREDAVRAGELLALPAPSFLGGMFDGSFRYALTPRIVKLFWILSLVLAGMVLTLSLGGALLTTAGFLMAGNSPSPSPGGTLGVLFVSVLYQLLTIAGTLMWLLFVRMLLEAFCVLHGIRASVRTMAAQDKA